MYGPGGSFVHQGCYFTEIAAFAAGVLGLWALSPRLAVFVTACHIAFTLILFVFLGPPKPVGFATNLGPVNPLLACFSVLAAVAFVFVLWKMSHQASDEYPES